MNNFLEGGPNDSSCSNSDEHEVENSRSHIFEHVQDVGWPDDDAPETEQQHNDVRFLIEFIERKRHLHERIE